MSKHVLVTGGAGFIGSHLVDAYIGRGWRVSIIDNLSTGLRRNLNPAAEFHEADLRDPATAELVTELRPDVVNHHAAQMDVRVSVADPVLDAGINVVGSVRLLEAARGAGVRRILFASSGGALYGEPVEVPQTEGHPANPLSPYGCAKLSVEHYLYFYREVHGMETVALRYANVYGPRQNAHGEAGVVAIFAGRILSGEDTTINGDGAQTRDFVYVGDVVAANMAASETLPSGAYNVGTGVETSITDLYGMMASIAGVDRAALHGPAKLGEQMRSVLDASRLRTTAKLGAAVPFRDGLERTIEWFQANR
jgi:UDP-glucose 4-epimerase